MVINTHIAVIKRNYSVIFLQQIGKKELLLLYIIKKQTIFVIYTALLINNN